MATALQGNPRTDNPEEEEEQVDKSEYWTFVDKINRLCKEGRLKQAVGQLHAMCARSIWMASTDLYAQLLQACSDTHSLIEGKRIHALMNKMGYYKADIFLGNHLINMYSKCGSILDARHLFDRMPARNVCSSNMMIAGYAKCRRIRDARKLFDEMHERDVVSWTAIIAGYAQHQDGEEALQLFQQMLHAGMKSNHFTFASVVSVCSSLEVLKQGKQVHAYIIHTGFESYESVGNALITMYAKCGSIESACRLFNRMSKRNTVSWNTIIARCAKCGMIGFARQLFDEMPERNIVSWTAMITGYEQHGRPEEAMIFFERMLGEGLSPDQFTFASVLSACASLLDLRWGKKVHAHSIVTGFEKDVFVGSALVDMYIKFDDIDHAFQVFDKMPERNVLSWTAMMVGYAQKGHGYKALSHFLQMHCAGIKPDELTFASVLSACASLTALEQGKQVHVHIVRSGYEAFVGVSNSLITMYAKSGSIDNAEQVFKKMIVRDEVSWTAMVVGYAHHGLAKEALQVFDKMLSQGMSPDHVTFIGVLSACNHAGLVDEGCQYFDSMTRCHQITPKADHYACMIDLLGRSGRLSEAEVLIDNMPFEPDATVWGALLSACRTHGNIDVGKCAAEKLFKLEPQNAATYVQLSNTYAAAGRWDDAAKVRKMMKERGVKKDAGCSWIEVKSKWHAFVAGDNSHPQLKEITEILKKLSGQMKEAGYLPDSNFVMQNED